MIVVDDEFILYVADFCIWPTGTKRAGELGVCGTITLFELVDCLFTAEIFCASL